MNVKMPKLYWYSVYCSTAETVMVPMLVCVGRGPAEAMAEGDFF